MRRWGGIAAICAAMFLTEPATAQQPLILLQAQAQPPAQAQPAPPVRGRYDYIAARGTGGLAKLSGGKNTGTLAGRVTNTGNDDIFGGGGLAIGFDWQKFGWPVRTEVEYNLTYRFDYDARPPLSSSVGFGLENNLRTHAFMVNAYYDIKNRTRWTPYIGVGIGMARKESNAKFSELAEIPGKRQQNRSDVVSSLAWAAGLGVRYAWSERWTFEIGYRFMNFGKVETGPFFNGTALEFDKFYIHDLVLGAAFHF